MPTTLHSLLEYIAQPAQNAETQIIATSTLIGIQHTSLISYDIEHHTHILIHLGKLQTRTTLERHKVKRLLNDKLHITRCSTTKAKTCAVLLNTGIEFGTVELFRFYRIMQIA